MESSEYSDVYKKFDNDGDGNITPDELINVRQQPVVYCETLRLSDFGETWRGSDGAFTLLQRYE